MRKLMVALVLLSVMASVAAAGNFCQQAKKYNGENWVLNYYCWLETMFELGW